MTGEDLKDKFAAELRSQGFDVWSTMDRETGPSEGEPDLRFFAFVGGVYCKVEVEFKSRYDKLRERQIDYRDAAARVAGDAYHYFLCRVEQVEDDEVGPRELAKLLGLHRLASEFPDDTCAEARASGPSFAHKPTLDTAELSADDHRAIADLIAQSVPYEVARKAVLQDAQRRAAHRRSLGG